MSPKSTNTTAINCHTSGCQTSLFVQHQRSLCNTADMRLTMAKGQLFSQLRSNMLRCKLQLGFSAFFSAGPALTIHTKRACSCLLPTVLLRQWRRRSQQYTEVETLHKLSDKLGIYLSSLRPSHPEYPTFGLY